MLLAGVLSERIHQMKAETARDLQLEGIFLQIKKRAQEGKNELFVSSDCSDRIRIGLESRGFKLRDVYRSRKDSFFKKAERRHVGICVTW